MRPNAETILQAQTITDNEPGSVLRDFQTLLEFLGPEGLRTSGKYRLLPMARLAELDQQMTRPLQPRLKRPQQHSYPHLHALYLLLRASGLGIEQGHGKSARLVREASLFEQWRTLNPTERYFHLLEAWLLRAEPSMIGESGGFGRDPAVAPLTIWKHLPPDGWAARDGGREFPVGLYGVRQLYQLALLELFGFVAVDRDPPREGGSGRLAAVRPTGFGEALLGVLLEDALDWLGRSDRLLDEGDEGSSARFGYWQPMLQPYFPEWRNNLTLSPPEFHEGLYEFTASLGSACWRRIAISAYDTLDELAWAIIRAVEFDGDHLYAFTFRDRDGTTVNVGCTGEDEVLTHEMQVGYLPLSQGQSLSFIYDFGAWWRFRVKLERVGPLDEEPPPPRVVASRGEAPEEYPGLE